MYKRQAVLGGSRIDSFRTWRVEGDDEGAFLAKWGENAPRHEPSWAHKQVISEFLSNISHDVVVPDVVLSAVKVISCLLYTSSLFRSQTRVMLGCNVW